MSDKIVVRNMVFYGYHGVFEAERELGQQFEVDVELYLDLRAAAQADDIDMTLNYVEVYTMVKEIVEEREFRLIETLAETIADQVLDAYDLDKVVVRVRKPHVAMGGLTGGVEIEIERNRADKNLSGEQFVL